MTEKEKLVNALLKFYKTHPKEWAEDKRKLLRMQRMS
jgi:hypothetical protein